MAGSPQPEPPEPADAARPSTPGPPSGTGVRFADIRSSRPFQLLIASLAVAISAPFLGAWIYGGEIIWPLIIGGYSSAALAFTTALFWDRHSRLQDEVRQNEAERRRVVERLQQEQERRIVEARRRFGALELELSRLQASIERTKREQGEYKHFFPDLPTGSWAAASAPLGLIVSDYELMADLATFYGHVEELRWRLRSKADPATALVQQVGEQARNPSVEQIVGAPPQAQRTARVSRTRQFTGAIRAQTPEEIARALAKNTLPGLEGGPTAADGSS
jgi:hypothetical protein